MGRSIAKYSRKLDGSVIGRKYDDTKKLAVKLQKPYFIKAADLEIKVKAIVGSEPTILHHYYIAYAEEFAKHTRDSERWIIYLKWLRRGLNLDRLLDISENLFNWSTGGTWVWDVTAEWDEDRWY